MFTEKVVTIISPSLCFQPDDCGHMKELKFLRERNEELENDNAALHAQNREMWERVDGLRAELSIKEATWCEMEEKFKLEVRRR